MARRMMTDRPLHPMAERYARAYRGGRLSRREFLATLTGLGVTAGAAAALGGLSLPRPARADEPVRGGTLRIAMQVKAIKDPRTWDWPEMASIGRQSVEYLVRWNRDFTFSPWLLEAWEANDDATEFRLTLREGVRWASGEPLTAEHVVFNVARWCDRHVAGNSMAGRMASLVDPGTGRMAAGAATAEDARTVVLRPRQSDITLIPGMADYPAAIVHPGFDPGAEILPQLNLGTGPFAIESWLPGIRATAIRREDYWGGPAYLDRVEWIDYGTDPRTMVAALKAREVDCNAETLAGSVDTLDELGLERSEVTTANTIVARFHSATPPYDDVRVRRAAQLACDNRITLAIGYKNRGAPAENHHVGPMHEEYAPLPAVDRDVARARALLAEAGQEEHEFDLISIDDDWTRATTDAMWAQLRDAGMKVKRTVIPAATFWNNWSTYPFSTTTWNARPLGVQVLALAYRTGEAWNETAFSDPEFDAGLDEALALIDPDARRLVMARLQTILRDSGVIIQPYWRTVFRHQHPWVRNFAQHQSFDQHLEEVWIDR